MEDRLPQSGRRPQIPPAGRTTMPVPLPQPDRLLPRRLHTACNAPGSAAASPSPPYKPRRLRHSLRCHVQFQSRYFHTVGESSPEPTVANREPYVRAEDGLLGERLDLGVASQSPVLGSLTSPSLIRPERRHSRQCSIACPGVVIADFCRYRAWKRRGAQAHVHFAFLSLARETGVGGLGTSNVAVFQTGVRHVTPVKLAAAFAPRSHMREYFRTVCFGGADNTAGNDETVAIHATPPAALPPVLADGLLLSPSCPHPASARSDQRQRTSVPVPEIGVDTASPLNVCQPVASDLHRQSDIPR